MSNFDLFELEKIVTERASTSPENSWTAKLVSQGMEKAAKKMGEEAVEAVIAAVTKDRNELVKESADLLFHLLVVLNIADVSLEDIMSELSLRTNRSGLDEKASRK